MTTISNIMVVSHKTLAVVVNILLVSVYLRVFVLIIEAVAEVWARGRVRSHHLIAQALFWEAIRIGC